MTEYKNNSLLMGRTTGQLLAEFQASKNDSNKKERRRQNIAMGLSVLIGGADATLQNRSNNTLKKLDESKVTDIAKSSKQYDDAIKLQNVQDSINQYGGGIGGAQIHYNAIAETAFNAQHENLNYLFEGEGETQANRDMKKKWKNSYIEDNLYKTHEAKYKGIDAAKISSKSKEEFNKPIQDYYSNSIRLANDPSNRSIIHKGLNKSAELVGFRTKRDSFTDKAVESEIALAQRNKTINDYREMHSQQNFKLPEKYTRDTIMGEKMTNKEFSSAWKGAGLNLDAAQAALEDFETLGSTYGAYESVQVGYLAEQTLKDSEAIIRNATIKVTQSGGWDELPQQDKDLAIQEATLVALGLPATQVSKHRQSNIIVNGWIKDEMKGFELPEDDASTEINEKEERRAYLQLEEWAKIQKETMRLAQGEIDYDKMRADFVTARVGILASNIEKGDMDTNTQITNIQLPLGDTAKSRLYGQKYLEDQVQLQYKGPANTATREKILKNLRDSRYSLFGRGQGTKALTDGSAAKKLVRAAQTNYYIHEQTKLLGNISYMYIEMLKEQE